MFKKKSFLKASIILTLLSVTLLVSKIIAQDDFFKGSGEVPVEKMTDAGDAYVKKVVNDTTFPCTISPGSIGKDPIDMLTEGLEVRLKTFAGGYLGVAKDKKTDKWTVKPGFDAKSPKTIFTIYKEGSNIKLSSLIAEGRFLVVDKALHVNLNETGTLWSLEGKNLSNLRFKVAGSENQYLTTSGRANAAARLATLAKDLRATIPYIKFIMAQWGNLKNINTDVTPVLNKNIKPGATSVEFSASTVGTKGESSAVGDNWPEKLFSENGITRPYWGTEKGVAGVYQWCGGLPTPFRIWHNEALKITGDPKQHPAYKLDQQIKTLVANIPEEEYASVENLNTLIGSLKLTGVDKWPQYTSYEYISCEPLAFPPVEQQVGILIKPGASEEFPSGLRLAFDPILAGYTKEIIDRTYSPGKVFEISPLYRQGYVWFEGPISTDATFVVSVLADSNGDVNIALANEIGPKPEYEIVLNEIGTTLYKNGKRIREVWAQDNSFARVQGGKIEDVAVSINKNGTIIVTIGKVPILSYTDPEPIPLINRLGVGTGFTSARCLGFQIINKPLIIEKPGYSYITIPSAATGSTDAPAWLDKQLSPANQGTISFNLAGQGTCVVDLAEDPQIGQKGYKIFIGPDGIVVVDRETKEELGKLDSDYNPDVKEANIGKATVPCWISFDETGVLMLGIGELGKIGKPVFMTKTLKTEKENKICFVGFGSKDGSVTVSNVTLWPKAQITFDPKKEKSVIKTITFKEFEGGLILIDPYLFQLSQPGKQITLKDLFSGREYTIGQATAPGTQYLMDIILNEKSDQFVEIKPLWDVEPPSIKAKRKSANLLDVTTQQLQEKVAPGMMDAAAAMKPPMGMGMGMGSSASKPAAAPTGDEKTQGGDNVSAEIGAAAGGVSTSATQQRGTPTPFRQAGTVTPEQLQEAKSKLKHVSHNETVQSNSLLKGGSMAASGVMAGVGAAANIAGMVTGICSAGEKADIEAWEKERDMKIPQDQIMWAKAGAYVPTAVEQKTQQVNQAMEILSTLQIPSQLDLFIQNYKKILELVDSSMVIKDPSVRKQLVKGIIDFRDKVKNAEGDITANNVNIYAGTFDVLVGAYSTIFLLDPSSDEESRMKNDLAIATNDFFRDIFVSPIMNNYGLTFESKGTIYHLRDNQLTTPGKGLITFEAKGYGDIFISLTNDLGKKSYIIDLGAQANTMATISRGVYASPILEADYEQPQYRDLMLDSRNFKAYWIDFDGATIRIGVGKPNASKAIITFNDPYPDFAKDLRIPGIGSDEDPVAIRKIVVNTKSLDEIGADELETIMGEKKEPVVVPEAPLVITPVQQVVIEKKVAAVKQAKKAKKAPKKVKAKKKAAGRKGKVVKAPRTKVPTLKKTTQKTVKKAAPKTTLTKKPGKTARPVRIQQQTVKKVEGKKTAVKKASAKKTTAKKAIKKQASSEPES